MVWPTFLLEYLILQELVTIPLHGENSIFHSVNDKFLQDLALALTLFLSHVNDLSSTYVVIYLGQRQQFPRQLTLSNPTRPQSQAYEQFFISGSTKHFGLESQLFAKHQYFQQSISEILFSYIGENFNANLDKNRTDVFACSFVSRTFHSGICEPRMLVLFYLISSTSNSVLRNSSRVGKPPIHVVCGEFMQITFKE